MLIALRDNQRIIPTATGQRANCPECNAEVLSKCGEINIWHWAHITTVNCDTWGEPEGEWHLNWKRDLPLDWVEVVMERDECKHRADIRLPTGLVIELQHSPISVEDIQKREAFYQNMIWIFDLSELPKSDSIQYEQSALNDFSYDDDPVFVDSNDGYGFDDNEDPILVPAQPPEPYIEPRFILRQWPSKDPTYRTFRWKHARKHIAHATKPVFFDLGEDQLLRLKKMYPESPVGGWGFLVERERLVQSIVAGKLSLKRRSATA
jgi:competence protein CoiA